MAYDRYEPRDRSRDEPSRWRDEQSGRHNERGFFERAGDEVASWFGDDEAERRRREDERSGERERGSSRDWRGDDHRSWNDRDRASSSRHFSDDDRGGPFSRSSYRGYGG